MKTFLRYQFPVLMRWQERNREELKQNKKIYLRKAVLMHQAVWLMLQEGNILKATKFFLKCLLYSYRADLWGRDVFKKFRKNCY